MSENKEEEEIKIEYFESFDTDPLCEFSEKPTSASSDSATLNICDENINQRNSNDVNESVDNIGVNDENEYPAVNQWRAQRVGTAYVYTVHLDKKTWQDCLHFVNYLNRWYKCRQCLPSVHATAVNEYEETWYKSIDNLGRYLCKFCENAYSTIQTIRHHVKNKHLDDYNRIKGTTKDIIRRRKLKCHICKIRFQNKDILQEHIQTHGVNNIKKSCFVCHATFSNETEMLTHMCYHEPVRKKQLSCLICGYSTSKLSHLKQHEKTHSRKNQLKCSFCDYTTYHPPNLKIHERTHTNEKPYTCMFNGCDYRCTAKSGLSSHLLKHEKEKNIIYCDKCSYSTVYKQGLKKHLDSHRRNSVRTRF